MIGADLQKQQALGARTTAELLHSDATKKPPGTPSTTHRVSFSLWFVAVGRAEWWWIGLWSVGVVCQGHIPKDCSDKAWDEGPFNLQSTEHCQALPYVPRAPLHPFSSALTSL